MSPSCGHLPSAMCLNLGGVEASRKVTGLVALDPQNIYDVYDVYENSAHAAPSPADRQRNHRGSRYLKFPVQWSSDTRFINGPWKQHIRIVKPCSLDFHGEMLNIVK